MYDSRRRGNPRISGVRVYFMAGMDGRMGHVHICVLLPVFILREERGRACMFIVRTGAWLARGSPLLVSRQMVS
jgi:hypothetical protein